MVQVASGHTPLTASLPNVIWSSSDYMTAQYVPEFGGVTASIQGGYAKITATVGNETASCHVCSYYPDAIVNGTYFIKSEKSGRFLTHNSTSFVQKNIGNILQKWTITATNDGYYTLFAAYKYSYLSCNNSGSSPTLSETHDATSDSAKWIIKAVKYDTDNQFILMPKTLASEGYMLSVDANNNTDGGNLILQKWNNESHSLCVWSLHNAFDNRTTIPEWKTNVSKIAYHSGDIKTYLFFYANTSTPSYTTIQSNFFTGHSTAASQWSNALDVSISTDSLSTDTDILVYGVTYESYQSLTGKIWPDTVLGKTTPALDVDRGYSFVENTNKKVRIYETTDLVTMYIILGTDTSLVNAIFTHEMGHAIGFDQHSSNPSHIMYYCTTDNEDGDDCNYTVSADEAHDLKLIYDRYN